MKAYEGLHDRPGRSYGVAVNHGGLAPERRKQVLRKEQKQSKEQGTAGDSSIR